MSENATTTNPLPNPPTLAATAPAAPREPQQGYVKWYDPLKGYGFIHCVDGTDVFFHFTAITDGGSLRDGDNVDCEIVQTQRGPKAVSIRYDSVDHLRPITPDYTATKPVPKQPVTFKRSRNEADQEATQSLEKSK